MDGAPLGSIFRTYPTFNLYNNNNRSYVPRANSNFVIRGFLTVPTIRPDIHFEQKVESDPPREGIWGRETSEEEAVEEKDSRILSFSFFFLLVSNSGQDYLRNDVDKGRGRGWARRNRGHAHMQNRVEGGRRGGNGIYSSDNLHCHQHATKLDVARRDALYKRRRASHLHKVNCSLYFVTYSGISCTNYTTAREIFAP